MLEMRQRATRWLPCTGALPLERDSQRSASAVSNSVVVPVGTPCTMGDGAAGRCARPGRQCRAHCLFRPCGPGYCWRAAARRKEPIPSCAPRYASGDFPARVTYPVPTLRAPVSVSGRAQSIEKLPCGLCAAAKQELPSISTMVDATPNFVRNIDFELVQVREPNMSQAAQRLPTCGWYFSRI